MAETEMNDYSYSGDGSTLTVRGISYRRYLDTSISIAACPTNIERTLEKLEKKLQRLKNE